MSVLKGFLAAFTAISLWALGLVLIKLLSSYFHVFTQNFCRYSSAAIILLIMKCFRGCRFTKDIVKKALLPAFLVFLFQNITVSGVYMTSTVTASLIMRLNIIFSSFFAYLFLKEERRLIKSPVFMASLILSLTGAIGISLKGGIENLQLDLGSLLVLLGSMIWGLYLVSVKKVLYTVDTLTSSAMIFTLSSLMFVPLTYFVGELDAPFKAPLVIVVIMVVSGILSVGLGNFFNYIAMKEIGVSVSSLIGVFTPFLTAVFSFIILGEAITMAQVIYGSLIILGFLILVIGKERIEG